MEYEVVSLGRGGDLTIQLKNSISLEIQKFLLQISRKICNFLSNLARLSTHFIILWKFVRNSGTIIYASIFGVRRLLKLSACTRLLILYHVADCDILHFFMFSLGKRRDREKNGKECKAHAHFKLPMETLRQESWGRRGSHCSQPHR